MRRVKTGLVGPFRGFERATGPLFTKKRTTGQISGKKRRSRSELAKLKDRLWELCKQITRKQYGNKCYTCPATDLVGSNWHTGHFITDSTCSTELSYDLANLRPQCYSCNIHKSGNTLVFRRRLMQEIDKDFPDLLEQRNEETKGLQYDIIWYREKVEELTALLTSLGE